MSLTGVVEEDSDDGLTLLEKNRPELFNWDNPSLFCVVHGYSSFQQPMRPTEQFMEIREEAIDKGYLDFNEQSDCFYVTDKGGVFYRAELKRIDEDL